MKHATATLALLVCLAGCNRPGANSEYFQPVVWGPDEHGVVCYMRRADSSALACVKVGGADVASKPNQGLT